jgi:hypothetical protein
MPATRGRGLRDAGYEEDAGFAINGGEGWSEVKFTNHDIDLNGMTAIAMGSYEFTNATTGAVVKVEYTFGYKRCADGKPRIFLHHSSVPFLIEGQQEGWRIGGLENPSSGGHHICCN